MSEIFRIDMCEVLQITEHLPYGLHYLNTRVIISVLRKFTTDADWPFNCISLLIVNCAS